ncbi:2-oxoadipate dehydrogenase complex component E1 [Patella vulgata]|uniref:2-oxoadipate dehydrogenase complex component E1 n=1 Tax=Patella vulgata TaxID=6465 RepID=UPI00217F5442|nr:2-oxoadipate dehydrogenase complex component E1 [Patella vulgata]
MYRFMSNSTRLAGRHAKRCVTLYHSKTGVYGYKPYAESDNEKFVIQGDALQNRIRNGNIYQLVQAYRKFGHLKADLDPLGIQTRRNPSELSLERYGLSNDLNQQINTAGIFYSSQSQISIDDLVQQLEEQYCQGIAAEFDHLVSETEREWFAENFEKKSQIGISDERKTDLAKLLLKSQTFDHFLANKFTTVKRYGGEGGESMMGVFDEIFHSCSEYDVSNVVMCMPHRGRLNFLTCMLKFPPVIMLQKMKGKTEFPPDVKGTGDVLSHLYTSIDLEYGGKNVQVSFLPNPSHLEANDPVAVGKARAKQQMLQEGEYSCDDKSHVGDKVLCLQVHGDAAFSAQGIVAETLIIADCPHFTVGGSIHLIVNNQIGFTAEARQGRSSTYSSDIGKINSIPVLHVNSDYPEDVIRATSIAMKYRQKFRKDIIIDLMCYRKYGHNELDDPAFTNPLMYQAINSRKSIPDLYAEKIVSEGICEMSILDDTVKEWNTVLQSDISKVDSYVIQPFHLLKQWSNIQQAGDVISRWDTGVDIDTLKFIGAKSVEIPETWKSHSTIQKTHLDRRKQKLMEGKELDWATAEALSIGSLLYQGFNVRICGQDVGRGTFSHRHAMVIDQQTDDMYIPLNNISDTQQAFFEVANSALSEEAVLGFEYGMSLESPNNLIIWEAQFGDFFNGAQSIIDTYITSGETKWLLQSGIVMLLPHGMDGAGPEHSNARIERFLQLSDSKEDGIDSDDVNIQVVHPTTSAQYFHLLRRQMVRNYRKPLIIAAPKVILRLPAAASDLSTMGPGTEFQTVLGDSTSIKPDAVERVIFCSGKHYYNLVKERESRNINNTVFIRLESLCPFPAAEIQAELSKYSKAKDFIWSQEEHRNMGAWSFVAPRFENVVGCKLRYSGRDVLSTSAVGIGELHQREVKDIMEKTFS